MGKLKIASIGSSSSGNAYIVSDGNTRLLLDVGLTAKRIKEGLAECRLGVEDIQGIFITHEHTDHVKSIRAIAKACTNAKVYTSRGTIYNCDKFEYVKPEQLGCMAAQDVVRIGDICVKAFSLSHDASEPIGFSFTEDGEQLSVATDTGIVTDEIAEELASADTLVFEANHEESILQMGDYPYSLKRRILGEHGHLSNVTSGIALARGLLARKEAGLPSPTQRIMLAHLSTHNNTPDTALLTVKNILDENDLCQGNDFTLKVAAKDKLTML